MKDNVKHSIAKKVFLIMPFIIGLIIGCSILIVDMLFGRQLISDDDYYGGIVFVCAVAPQACYSLYKLYKWVNKWK